MEVYEGGGREKLIYLVWKVGGLSRGKMKPVFSVRSEGYFRRLFPRPHEREKAPPRARFQRAFREGQKTTHGRSPKKTTVGRLDDLPYIGQATYCRSFLRGLGWRERKLKFIRISLAQALYVEIPVYLCPNSQRSPL